MSKAATLATLISQAGILADSQIAATEVTNFTSEVRTSISVAANGNGTYDNTTGVITVNAPAVSISNDITTSSDVYPSLLAVTSGTASQIYTSNNRLLYKPLTGELKSSKLTSQGIMAHSNTLTESAALDSGYNGVMSGPFNINSGVNLSIGSGSVLTVLFQEQK